MSTLAATSKPEPTDMASIQGDVLHLRGRLDVRQVADTYRSLAAALNSSAALTIDMSQVEFIDTAGVQLLLCLNNELAHRADVRLRGPSTLIAEAFRSLGIDASQCDGIVNAC